MQEEKGTWIALMAEEKVIALEAMLNSMIVKSLNKNIKWRGLLTIFLHVKHAFITVYQQICYINKALSCHNNLHVI
jgi:hypothetical protein